ncbi:WXG100-like domain-containing protein [Streptomyces sp. NBC_01262]|uniref:WXG100-like domain-containing protein n=1 Tax=Streptomyces sp. NBC_01262 TaxID=2903803 RepID=UPI002E308FDA|nr:hypothetical protein [Streptomyces sp. NBC_01262]
MSAADKAREIVQDLTGMWWPDADEDDLREAARAWRTFADAVDDVAAATNKQARSLVENNKGESIEAFDAFWRRYVDNGKGWLKDLPDAARDMAKALDQYADAVHEATTRLEHELEIVGATIVAGTALAFFTAGISEGVAVAATTTIVELAGELGVAVSAEVATIAGTTLTSVAIGGIESATVDLAVAQPLRIAQGEQSGLNLDEVQDAALYGGLTAGALTGSAGLYRSIADGGGIPGMLDGLPLGIGQPRLATAGADELPSSSNLTTRMADEGNGATGSGPGRGPWPAQGNLVGPAASKSLKFPNARHTVSGSSSGEVKAANSVILRGHEQDIAKDISDIAKGKATFNEKTQHYEINGRSYGVEGSGTVYPVRGAGIVELDRNEYAALQQVAKAKGDISAAPQLTRNPRFTNNPGIVEKALEIYNGTYQ